MRSFSIELLGWALVAIAGIGAAAGAGEESHADSMAPEGETPVVTPPDSSFPGGGTEIEAPPAVDPESIPEVDVVVVVPKFGEFRIRLDRQDAPNHVAHFLTLVADGFYDGMSFHRVIPNLLIQTGDPSSRDDNRWNDGFGAPPYRLPPEPSRETHRRGSVSMVWQGERPGTAGSQWMVSLGDLPELDAHGTVIGEIVEGMDTVDRISQVTTLRNWNPLSRVEIEKVHLAAPRPVATSDSKPPPASRTGARSN